MSVQSEITRLADAKSAIATAIAGKGVTVPDGTKLDGMAALIDDIAVSAMKERYIYFYDYDGTPLNAIAVSDLNSSNLPTPPTHEGLTFMGWAWSLETMQSVTGSIIMLPKYKPTDGKTHVFLDVSKTTTYTIYLCIKLNHSVVINWGDGKVNTTLTATSSASILSQNSDYRILSTTHQYSEGSYEITFTGDADTYALGWDSSKSTCLFGEITDQTPIDAAKEIWACNCIVSAGACGYMRTLTKYVGYNVKYNIYPDNNQYKAIVDNRIFNKSPVETVYLDMPTLDSFGVDCFMDSTIVLVDYGKPLPYFTPRAPAYYTTLSIENSMAIRGAYSPNPLRVKNCPVLLITSAQKVASLIGPNVTKSVYLPANLTPAAGDFASTTITDIYVPWSEGAVSGAPWGAINATIHYNYAEG